MAADDIRGALTAQVATLGLPTAYENVGFDTPPNTVWLRATYLPGIPTLLELGPSGADRYTGTYQVDVFAPLGLGDGQARSTVNAVTAAFAKGSVLTRNGQKVRVLRSYATTGIRPADSPYYQIPVRVDWYADV